MTTCFSRVMTSSKIAKGDLVIGDYQRKSGFQETNIERMERIDTRAFLQWCHSQLKPLNPTSEILGWPATGLWTLDDSKGMECFWISWNDVFGLARSWVKQLVNRKKRNKPKVSQA